MRRLLLILAAALWLCATAHAASDEETIRQVLRGMFDKPEATIALDAVVVEADYGIADWSQGQIGGRAFLRRKGETWQLILCAGDEIRSADALVRVGVPAQYAVALAHKLASAERSLPVERLALFSTFHGIVSMENADQPHPNHER
jgi:hypothetical protein